MFILVRTMKPPGATIKKFFIAIAYQPEKPVRDARTQYVSNTNTWMHYVRHDIRWWKSLIQNVWMLFQKMYNRFTLVQPTCVARENGFFCSCFWIIIEVVDSSIFNLESPALATAIEINFLLFRQNHSPIFFHSHPEKISTVGRKPNK